jgi:hypothetical protein
MQKYLEQIFANLFALNITAGIHSIVFGYIYLVKKIELLTISTDNIWNLCGLELTDISIQQEFIFIGTGKNIPENSRLVSLIYAFCSNCPC